MAVAPASGRGRGWHTWFVGVVAAVLVVVSAAGVSRADRSGSCAALPIPVTGGTLAATLCLPAQPTGRVMILMPGAAVDHWYWDAGGVSQAYNFRRAMNDAGYATLVVDRFGDGASDRPPSTSLTSPGDAQGLHEIVGLLRRGLPGAPAFTTVISGGVSLSSGIAVMEAADFHDVDGVLLTGFSHEPDFAGIMRIVGEVFLPAAADPKFRGRGYDMGYWSVAPGAATAAAFLGPGSDPAVVQGILTNRDVFTWTEFASGMSSTVLDTTKRITVPVMLVNGSVDRLCAPQACASTASLRAAEAPYFSPSARLRVYVLPRSGHAVNLAPDTVEYQRQVVDWAARIRT